MFDAMKLNNDKIKTTIFCMTGFNIIKMTFIVFFWNSFEYLMLSVIEVNSLLLFFYFSKQGFLFSTEINFNPFQIFRTILSLFLLPSVFHLPTWHFFFPFFYHFFIIFFLFISLLLFSLFLTVCILF